MKILFVSPNPTDPLSFYRGIGPLSVMRKQFGFDYEVGTNISWAQVRSCDFVFMQRPFNSQHVQVAEMCQKWNVPMICDFDDWLYELMPDNPSFDVYESSKNNLEKVRAIASRTIVTTEYMKNLYSEIGTDADVIPNAYDTDLLQHGDIDDRNKIVLWRGGNSHLQDILSVRMGFVELIRRHKDWQFFFLNVKPWFLGEEFDNVKHVQGMGLIEYFEFIKKAKPAIMTHPLLDSPFNRAKSMCSWIEAGHAGAAFVGPDFEEFKRPGCINYQPNSSESFFNAINNLINNPHGIIENARMIQKEITGPLSLKNVNEKRWEIFKSI
jgi:hypothetical protein